MVMKTYRLRFGEFEVEGDKDFVLEMVKRYGPHGDSAPITSEKEKKAMKSVHPSLPRPRENLFPFENLSNEWI